MFYAYQEIYQSRAQNKLGDAFDYAINTCEIPGKDFVLLQPPAGFESLE